MKNKIHSFLQSRLFARMLFHVTLLVVIFVYILFLYPRPSDVDTQPQTPNQSVKVQNFIKKPKL